MIALLTIGPMNALVLPMMEYRLKNKNLPYVSNVLGDCGERYVLFPPRRNFRYHRLRIRVPLAHKETIKGLVNPELPFVMEAEFLGPNSNHAPAVEEDDANHDRVKHDLRAESEPF